MSLKNLSIKASIFFTLYKRPSFFKTCATVSYTDCSRLMNGNPSTSFECLLSNTAPGFVSSLPGSGPLVMSNCGNFSFNISRML